jgi:septal ring factor EnvC (AmiA/AmiB activator)
LFFAVVIILYLGLSLGCHSGPSFNNDSGYRAIEREADRNSVDLAVTGAEIAARVERIDRQENRVRSTLDSLEAALEGADIAAPEKDTLYQRLIAVRAEDEALSGEIQWLREDAGRLNGQLAEQREINAAMAEEHDRREAAGAAVKEEIAVTKEQLIKVNGQRNLAVVIAAALALAVIGYIAIRVRRSIRPP